MKKKIEIAILIIWGLFIIGLTIFHAYLHFSDKELILFGCVFDKILLQCCVVFLMFIGYVVIVVPEWIKKKAAVVKTVFRCGLLAAILIFAVWGVADTILSGVNEYRISQRLTLSDGTELLLTEETAQSSINEEYETKYLNIYQVSGITAERIGWIDETYFSNDCLEQDKYEYKYDEANRRLTITCEYGEYGNEAVRLKEEFDTGFMSFDFNLK